MEQNEANRAAVAADAEEAVNIFIHATLEAEKVAAIAIEAAKRAVDIKNRFAAMADLAIAQLIELDPDYQDTRDTLNKPLN